MSFGDTLRGFFAKKQETVEAVAPSGEVGWSESLIYSSAGWPKYDPDQLKGLQGYSVYRKMMTDEQVKAVVRFKRDAITGRKFYFEYDKADVEDAKETGTIEKPVDEKGTFTLKFDAMSEMDQMEMEGVEDQAHEENVMDDEREMRIRVFEQICEQMDGSFVEKLNGMETAVVNGFSLVEKVFKDIEVDGKTWTGLKDLKLRPSHTFRFHPDEFGNVKKLTQTWEGREQVIQDWENRFIHFVQNSDVDAHYGQSELREAYRPWFSKDMIVRFWNIYMERMAGGFVWIQPKDGKDIRSGTATHTSMQTALQTLATKTALIIPTGDIELKIEWPQNTDAFERAISAHDKAIAKALLVPNLLGISEQGGVGSYGQSQTQLEAFLWTLESDAKRLEEVLNEKLFKQLGEINFGTGPYPRFRFKPLSEAMKIQIIRLWKELVQAKAVTATDSDEDHIRGLLDFPDCGEPLANTAINPLTGLPMNAGGMPMNEDMTDGEQQTKDQPEQGKKNPVGSKKAGKPAGFSANASGYSREERAVFVERAVKRVDFAVIDNQSTRYAGIASTKMQEAIKDGMEEVRSFIRDNDLFNNADKVQDIEFPRRTVSRMRKIAEAALKDAWELGGQHARRELEKARGMRFAADEMRLRDDAAQKFLEGRSATIAADLSDNARKKITTVVFNGIKNGWSLDEIINRIDDEIGASVMPSASTAIRTTVFEAINESRYDLFASPEMAGFVEAMGFSAILDGKTTEICQHMDGKVYPVNDQLWETYTPPLHFNCRSLLIAVTTRDTWQTSTKPKLEPAEGFGGP